MIPRALAAERVCQRVATTALVALYLLACSPSSSPRDVVPESRDVRSPPGTNNSEAYVHVARRPHGTVALAEARHMSDEDARMIVERIADELERCATGLEANNLLVEGAARVVAVAGPDGTPALNVRLAPGDAVARNALICIVAPVRATTLPAPRADATPGLAIEATWGPARASAGPARGADAGGPL